MPSEFGDIGETHKARSNDAFKISIAVDIAPFDTIDLLIGFGSR